MTDGQTDGVQIGNRYRRERRHIIHGERNFTLLKMLQNQDDLQQARTMYQKVGESVKVITVTQLATSAKLLAYHYPEYISF